MGAIEGLAGGELDEAIAAGVDLFKEMRDRRRAAKEAAEVRPVGDEPAELKRPIRDALRDLLRGKKDEP